jgi:hypothetical protein
MGASSFYVAVVIMMALLTIAIVSGQVDAIRHRRAMRKAALLVASDTLAATATESASETARQLMAKYNIGGPIQAPATEETVLVMESDGSMREVPASSINVVGQ